MTGYDVSLETVRCEAAISKKACVELEQKIAEMANKIAVLHDNNKEQADKLETLQRKGIVLYNFMKLYSYYCCVYYMLSYRKIVWHFIGHYNFCRLDTDSYFHN